MGKKGSSSSNSGTTTQTAQPWEGARPYLLGQDANSPGVFPGAVQQYQNGMWTPEQQSRLNNWQQYLTGQQAQGTAVQNAGNALLSGAGNAQISPVGPIAGAPVVSAPNVNAQAVNPTQALGSLGAVDPTKALQNQLSGSVDNPYLNQQIDAIGADIGRNLNNNVLPGLRSQAIASGGFGGSRQGIAEGLAAQGANQQLAAQAANIRANAYEAAQNRQGTAAGNLSNLGFSNANNNANRDLSAQTTNAGNQLTASQANAANALNAQQFNANLGLQNNSQAMQNAGLNVGNLTAGANLVNSGFNMGNAAFGNAFQNAALPSQYGWQNLNNYANVITSGAGLGGTTTGTTSAGGGRNPIASALGGGITGGLLAGSSLGSSLGLSTPWGAGIGAGLGLLGLV